MSKKIEMDIQCPHCLGTGVYSGILKISLEPC